MATTGAGIGMLALRLAPAASTVVRNAIFGARSTLYHAPEGHKCKCVSAVKCECSDEKAAGGAGNTAQCAETKDSGECRGGCRAHRPQQAREDGVSVGQWLVQLVTPTQRLVVRLFLFEYQTDLRASRAHF